MDSGDRTVRFGTFDVDLKERELRHRGVRIHLQQKPFRILELLLLRRGELVTRDELVRDLWPNVHVSFDRGLNTAVNMLRRALGDSPKASRYIETRPRLGYRFVAAVEEIQNHKVGPSLDDTTDSIAILPFDSTTGDPEVELVVDGLTDSIIARLSEIEHIRVIARTTAFRFKGNQHEPEAVGHKLNVRTVLTGRVAPRNESLSISAELIEAKSGRRLWGANYQAGRTDVLRLEGDICVAVSKVLKLPAPANARPFSKTQTTSFEAYQDYLKGRYFYNRMSEEDLRKSIAHFNAALAQDSRYALAYTGLADTYTALAFMSLLPPAAARARIEEFVDAALSIDGELAEAHASLASGKKLFEWDWAGSEAAYLKALELKPNFADAHRRYAALLCALGRTEEGLAAIRRAHELDPLSLLINTELAWNFYMARDFRGAMEQSWRTLVLDARYAPAQHTLALAYEQLEMHEDALTEFQNACRCSENHPASIASLVHGHASAGREHEARRALRELEKLSERRYVSCYSMSIAFAGLGEDNVAITYLEKAVEERDVWVVWMNADPRFDCLRSDPRFDRLLQTVGLASAVSTSNEQ